MWFVWIWKRCWSARWSDAQDLEFVPYWCDLYRNILALNGRCQLSLGGVEFLVLFLVFGVELLWNSGMSDNVFFLLTSFLTLWCGVGCDTDNLWHGTRGDTGGTGNIRACKGRDICVRLGVGVATGRTIAFFFWLSRRVLIFWQVHFWFYHHIQVMVKLTVWFEVWKKCLLLNYWDNNMVWWMGKESG